RPDCFPLIAARECGQHALVDGNGEMIRPELGEPLDEGPIGRDRLAKARTGLGEIDGTDELRKLLERADRRVRARTRASPVIAAGGARPLGADGAAQVIELREDARGAL